MRTQSEEAKQASELESIIKQILELSDKEFKTTITDMGEIVTTSDMQ